MGGHGRHFTVLPVFESFLNLGGPSFNSAIWVALSCGLQPLKLQGLKPLSNPAPRRD
jgi:hypothetical protein